MENINASKSVADLLGSQLKQAFAQTFSKKEVSDASLNLKEETPLAPNSEKNEKTRELLQQRAEQSFRKVEVNELKSTIGEDQQFLKITLKNKLMEYGVHPNTRISLSKDVSGDLKVTGPMLKSELEKINQDLNNDANLKSAFQRVSQHEPTLSYVSNVVKLSQAYGANNNLFNSLISEDNNYNKLSDISHRYESMRTHNKDTAQQLETGFEFKL
jgi:hypothetical protein